MRKILITGGAGFVGRRFVQHFLQIGDEVHCVDPIVAMTGGIDPEQQWPLFDPRDWPNFKFYKEDCRIFFNRNIHTDDFDYVLHLAAVAGGRLMIENSPLAITDNLSIDSAYWQWAYKANPKKTICFSSSAAYPISFQCIEKYQLLKEDMINFNLNVGIPDLSYGWAKLTLEYIAKLAFKKHALKSVVYRPFSGYGEDQDDSYPFPSICKRAINSKDLKTLKVWGSGREMRDFIYIDDCIEGVLLTMDKIDNGEALNLSTGIFTSFNDFAKKTAQICGYVPKIEGTLSKPTGVYARAGDTTKQKQFGFIPKTSFEAGITKALKYYQKLESEN